MKYIHEVIPYENEEYMHASVRSVSYWPPHWHHSAELMMVLDGEMQVVLEQEMFILHREDVILVNSNEIHELESEHCTIGVIQIPSHSLKAAGVAENVRFVCNSVMQEDRECFYDLQCIMARIWSTVLGQKRSDSRNLLLSSMFYQLMYELTEHFQREEESQVLHKPEQLERLNGILEYIQLHYDEEITLQQAAAQVHLTPTYFSMLFKKNMGITFFQYLTSTRLHHARADLAKTKDTIENIAVNNGFSSSKYFVKAFKEQYNMTPGSYRSMKTEQEMKEVFRQEGPQIEIYTSLGGKILPEILSKYLKGGTQDVHHGHQAERHQEVRISVKKQGIPIRNTWQTLICVGKAKEILMKDIQSQLKKAQHDIGFQYVKFHGILDDAMMLYNEHQDGTPYLCYYYVDEVIDFLLSIGLRPMIEFSFMPRLLSKNPHRTVFQNSSIISRTKSEEKWKYLIKELVCHFIRRYSREEVAKWLFTFWNSPFQEMPLQFESQKDFHHLYEITYSSVKECDENLKFGSTAYLSFQGPETSLKEYLDYCREQFCYPDFYLFDFYAVEKSSITGPDWLEQLTRTYRDEEAIGLSVNDRCLEDYLDSMEAYLQEYPKLPIYLGQWNFTCSQREWLNDTCYSSVYLMKNLLENLGRAESFGHWCLTDMFEETQYEEELFYGNVGMFARHSVKKPVYYAYCLLKHIGNQLIGKGDGYFLTRCEDGAYVMILYNYLHYSRQYADGLLLNAASEKRYRAFQEMERREVTIELEDLEKGTYLITDVIVNREHGSAYDQWVRMGSQPVESRGEIQVLKDLSAPMVRKQKISIDKKMDIHRILEPLEVRLVRINRETQFITY